MIERYGWQRYGDGIELEEGAKVDACGHDCGHSALSILPILLWLPCVNPGGEKAIGAESITMVGE